MSFIKVLEKYRKVSFSERDKGDIIRPNKMIKDKQKKTITTLEIGCGFGKVSNDLATLKFKSFGTDISNTAIIKARKKGTAKFYQSNFLNEKLYNKINPDILILSEVSWYVLPELKKFIKYINQNE